MCGFNSVKSKQKLQCIINCNNVLYTANHKNTPQLLFWCWFVGGDNLTVALHVL